MLWQRRSCCWPSRIRNAQPRDCFDRLIHKHSGIPVNAYRHIILPRPCLVLPIVQYHFLFDMEMRVCMTPKVARLSVALMPADRCVCVSQWFPVCLGIQTWAAVLFTFSPQSWERTRHRDLLHPWAPSLARESERVKRYHQRKVTKNTPTITHSWSPWHNWWLM